MTATFDSFLAEQDIRLSGTPVRVEFKLRGVADEEESHYEWLGVVWGLSHEDPMRTQSVSPASWYGYPLLECGVHFESKPSPQKAIVATR